MERDTEVKMTVKEWAEKSGLKLYNYDGFKGIYSKLSGNDAGILYEDLAIRFRDAGDLICTRRAFESRLMSCTIQLPEMSQYEEMADVIPEFVEGHINLLISARIGQLKYYSLEGDDLREN